MLNKTASRSSHLNLWLGLVGLAVGILAGFAVGVSPALLFLAIVAVAGLTWFFASFEQAVIGLLILRSSLDLFSYLQIPAAFAIALNGLTVLYVLVALLTGKAVKIDKFWWFFALWVIFQSLWVILLPLGGLGMDASFLMNGVRVWLRYFSWLMVYLLVMQLKDSVPPEKIISLLLLSLVAPISIALLQIFIPESMLPPLLTAQGKAGSNVSGTLGFPNGLGIFLTMFIALVWWKLSISSKRLPWLLLLGLVSFVFVRTGYFTGVIAVFLLILFINSAKITPIRVIGVALFCCAFLWMFGSTEFGQQRLTEIYDTPLLNPNIDVSRSIILSYGDGNSFNWRIAHWTYLINAWNQFPILGYGLDTSRFLGIRNLETGGGYEAHNDYIRFLVEQGIVGLIGFLCFLFVQIWHLISLLRNSQFNYARRNLCLLLIALYVANAVSMLTSNIVDATTFFFYWWTLVAIAGWGDEYWNPKATKSA
jgi:O-antigen ligase